MQRRMEDIAMFGLACLWTFPLIWTLWTSFRPRDMATTWELTPDFTLNNFMYVWDGAPFAQYYLNTLIIVTGILAVQIVTATLAAYVFAKVRFWGRDILFILF